ncbi:MAG: carbonic anhydrase [Hyphomicrobiales bacterium]
MPDTSNAFPAFLSDGYRAFRDGRLRDERERYEALAELGQKPTTMLISCCDSRAAPETIFNAAPGELFVVRNVANLVPPYEIDDGLHGTSAALEFAVQGLKVENIVIMGHGRCGGVNACLNQHEAEAGIEPLSAGDFIGNWISILEPAIDKMICADDADPAARRRALEEAGIRHSIENLMTFPFIKTLVESGKMKLHGAWFDISSGELFTMDRETGVFGSVD